MKKIIFIFSIAMAGSIIAMQEAEKIDYSHLYPITYEIRPRLERLKFRALLLKKVMTKTTFALECLNDSINKEKKYSVKGIDFVPTAMPLYWHCSPQDNGDFFETRECCVQKNGTCVLTFDNDIYEVTVTQNGVTTVVDTDTVVNGRARYAQRDKSTIENAISLE